MHSTRIGAYTFHHNSDMSGTLEIVNSSGTRFQIGPARVVLDFVAQFVAGQKVAALERSDTESILGLPPQGSWR